MTTGGRSITRRNTRTMIIFWSLKVEKSFNKICTVSKRSPSTHQTHEQVEVAVASPWFGSWIPSWSMTWDQERLTENNAEKEWTSAPDSQDIVDKDLLLWSTTDPVCRVFAAIDIRHWKQSWPWYIYQCSTYTRSLRFAQKDSPYYQLYILFLWTRTRDGRGGPSRSKRPLQNKKSSDY